MIGKLMYLSINDFFSEYIRTQKIDMDKTEIIIVSKDIQADISERVQYEIRYQSRYENIDFVPSLFPTAQNMEVYHGSSFDRFQKEYYERLSSAKCTEDLCAIVDLVVNDGYDVFILCTNVDLRIEFMEILTEYIYDIFHLQMVSYKEYKENPKIILEQGDPEEIKTMWQFQLKSLQLINENVTEFINRFSDDMVEKYKEILMGKSIDELCVIASKYNLHVNKRRPKEFIVDHIVEKLTTKND